LAGRYRLADRDMEHQLICMHKASRASICGLIGLTGFGVAHDCGLFGVPDGHDHSATVSIASSSGTLTMSSGVVYATNNVTGDDIAIPGPLGQHQGKIATDDLWRC
jgi:hypothetical protein